jgi:hypothetical protein
LVHKESGKGCKSHLVRILIAAQVLALLGLGFRAERLTVPKGDPQGWSPRVVPNGGPPEWYPRVVGGVPKGGVVPYGGPQRWYLKMVAGPRGWSPRVVPKGGPQRWSPRVVPKGGPKGGPQ